MFFCAPRSHIGVCTDVASVTALQIQAIQSSIRPAEINKYVKWQFYGAHSAWVKQSRCCRVIAYMKPWLNFVAEFRHQTLLLKLLLVAIHSTASHSRYVPCCDVDVRIAHTFRCVRCSWTRQTHTQAAQSQSPFISLKEPSLLVIMMATMMMQVVENNPQHCVKCLFAFSRIPFVQQSSA